MHNSGQQRASFSFKGISEQFANTLCFPRSVHSGGDRLVDLGIISWGDLPGLNSAVAVLCNNKIGAILSTFSNPSILQNKAVPQGKVHFFNFCKEKG